MGRTKPPYPAAFRQQIVELAMAGRSPGQLSREFDVSAQSITATGATFATATELNEPDSTTGNDIGGYSAYAHVDSGSSTTAPSVTTTVGGVLTNIRGPVVLVRIREASGAVTHATTGTLTGQIGAVAGSARHNIPHATSGGLTSQGSAIAGSADRATGTVTHATTGALIGPASNIVGSATRFRAHASSGILAGQTATVIGNAGRFRAFATSGALSGAGSSVAGSSARTRAHANSGVLTGAGALLSGASSRFRAHSVVGNLVANESQVSGSALRSNPIVAPTHDTTGALVGPESIIVGLADPEPPQPEYLRGEGWGGILHKGRPRSFRREKAEREELRSTIQQAISPIVATEAKVVTVGNNVAVITPTGPSVAIPVPPAFDAKAVSIMVSSMLEKAGIEAQRVRSAAIRKQASIVLQQLSEENARRLRKQRRDAEFLLFM